MPRAARFTRDDWAAAALAILATAGPAAVAVEPVAARLGASKSSFYWLFENRQALLEAALHRWEQRQTDAVLPELAAIADPADRLRWLAREAFAAVEGADLALRLLTESADPVVRPVVERVTARRLGVIEAAFAELGQPAGQARHYARALYAAYLGTAALRRLDASLPGGGSPPGNASPPASASPPAGVGAPGSAAPPGSEDYLTALLAAFGVEAR